MGPVVDGHSRRLTFRLLGRIGNVDDWLRLFWQVLQGLSKRVRELHRRAILPAAGAHKDSIKYKY